MSFCDKNPKVIKKFGIWCYEHNYLPVPLYLKNKIDKLPIPPMYKSFWVSKNNSNVLAVWEDSEGRKQYLYDENWSKQQSDKKYNRMKRFVSNVNKFWKQIDNDIHHTDPKIQMIAHMFLILKETYIRVGNMKYYKNNQSVGLTTLKREHIKMKGGAIVLNFKGKSNIHHEIKINNPIIIQFIKSLMKKKDEWLFTINNIRITSMDMNLYLKKAIGNEFKIKDFRTISANTIFIDTVKLLHKTNTQKQTITKALKITANKLGHNTATSKKSYVSKKIIDFYKEDPKKFIKQPTLKILKA